MIPNYQELMLPILKKLNAVDSVNRRDFYQTMSHEIGLTLEEKNQKLKTGQFVMQNRVGWAVSFLKKAGLIHYPQRGVFKITNEGQKLISANPSKIDNKFLMQYPSFRKFIKLCREKKTIENTEPDQTQDKITSEEQIESAINEIELNLADDVLELVAQQSPQFFEKIVVDLMLAMGYGGEAEDSGLLTSYSNDEGIDGLIKEDILGLDIIYLQAKRWQTNIGRPEVQKFVGALQGKRAKKGVFITTSTYTKDAVEYVKNLECKVVLIDGIQLAKLMIEHGVGIQSEKTVVIKKIDEDYWR